MADYDFTGLSPSDFESLCRDLLEPALGVPLQGFATGRDNGVDLRHAPVVGRDWIVQCKHFARSGYAKLRSHLKTKELPKIKKLQPSRYILATSVGLSPPNVDELFELLSPYCLSKHDIYGRTDLNALLSKHPSVEQAHFKLWLTSEPVLSRVLHNDVFVQSWLTEAEISLRLSLYVYTDSFDRALEKLDGERVCILSGIPGVGKTTLAEMLLVHYLMENWELVSIQQNVSEGQRLFRSDPKAKQVFYYDDFLGQVTKGDKLGKNEDRVLLQLIGAVARNPNKRFILTTREYILAQAKAEHEQLARSNIDLYRFVVKCDDYDALDKARILANHLYFAKVPQGHIAALIDTHSYREIIGHRNYNPRIVEWMTHVTETSACTPTKYPRVFLERLDNPTQLWTHAFENQISEASRHLLLVLGTCGDGILLSDVNEAFEHFYLDRARRYGFTATPGSMEKALKELEGTFVRIDSSGSDLVVACHNPSILDFLKMRLAQSPGDVRNLFQCASFFEQVERLFRMFQYCRIPSEKNGERLLDPSVVKDAIERTLDSKTVRLSRTAAHRPQWFRKRSSVWERLGVCCTIGSSIAEAELREMIQSQIDGQMKTIDGAFAELGEITALLETIDSCDWFEPKVVEAWHHGFQEMLFSREDEIGEPLDGLLGAAKWFARNWYRFDDDQGRKFVENLSEAVRREINENCDTSHPDYIDTDLAVLQEIAKAIKVEFEKEERWLCDKRAECAAKSSSEAAEPSSKEHRPTHPASSIESIFEALVE